MAGEIPFRRDFAFEYGRSERLTPLIRRVVARNPSPFTFKGTGTYIIGNGKVAVIDPGPKQQDHIDALLKALDEGHAPDPGDRQLWRLLINRRFENLRNEQNRDKGSPDDSDSMSPGGKPK